MYNSIYIDIESTFYDILNTGLQCGLGNDEVKTYLMPS